MVAAVVGLLLLLLYLKDFEGLDVLYVSLGGS